MNQLKKLTGLKKKLNQNKNLTRTQTHFYRTARNEVGFKIAWTMLQHNWLVHNLVPNFSMNFATLHYYSKLNENGCNRTDINSLPQNLEYQI